MTFEDPPAAAGAKQVLRIEIDDNGDAHWSIESRFILPDDESVDEFRDYAEALSAGERDPNVDPRQFEHRASEAADRTDREMTIRDAGWDDSRVESVDDVDDVDGEAIDTEEGEEVRVGTITYSLTWTNFATVENDRLYVGDAFQTDSGVWLSLNEMQRLVIEYPNDYALETPTQLDWDGSYQFSDHELEIVFVRSSGGSGAGPAGGISNWLIGGVVGIVFVVAIGSYLLARRNQGIDVPSPLERLPNRITELGPFGFLTRTRSRTVARDGPDEQGGAADTTGGTVVQSGADGPGAVDEPMDAAGTRLEYEETPDDEIDPELLSDEERVLRMLTQNGGRMKQASIVKETGWSNAKVSQLLSQMDEDGDIEKLRIGRENLITLPEVDPTELD
ncbi:helix-turn-helix transcriptional regulator [Natronorubrum sp. FCH18a]|uniref:helix-turn-helix transcriptional regulator n=1 Tax=Natronorubrum sp. FCH18a TaxID=3447018 RepID=UPI003F50F6FF